MVLEHDLGSACAKEIMPSTSGDSLQGEDIYRGKKERGMKEEEFSLLVFQTIEHTIEDLMKGKIWRNFLKGVCE